jgi:hypothetical protein
VANGREKPSASSRGSGRLRRLLYMTAVRCTRLKNSAFGQYYHRLVARGMKKVEALMAVMRKMLLVAYRLLRTEESYDPLKVCAAPAQHTPSADKLAAMGGYSMASFGESTIAGL